jgi:hypothetical protein
MSVYNYSYLKIEIFWEKENKQVIITLLKYFSHILFGCTCAHIAAMLISCTLHRYRYDGNN